MTESPNNNFDFTVEDVKTLSSTINTLFEKTGILFNQYQNQHKPNSIASFELLDFPSDADTAYSLGNLSMESAADHLVAFADLINEPVKTIAPWTCVRGLLESCALACWFLEPSIDAKTRIGRSFAFRYKGFEEQLKLYRKINDQTKISVVQQRIIKVEADAINLGFVRILNKNNLTCGIAQYMPSITELIDTTLDSEFQYRLLSAAAHGHHWAIQQIGFQVIELIDSNGQSIKGLKKTVHPNFLVYVGMVAVTSFAKVLWYMWQLYGWDLAEIINLLNSVYDKLNYNSNLRYWQTTV